MPMTITGSRSRRPRSQGPLEPAPPIGPRPPRRADHDAPVIRLVGHGELDPEPVRGQQLLDHVAPLHEQHVVSGSELLQPQIDDVLHPLEPVDVDVGDRKPALVLPDQCERRRHDRVIDGQPPRHPLNQRRLAGPELPREDHGVPPPQRSGERPPHLPCRLRRPRAQLQPRHQNNSICSSSGVSPDPSGASTGCRGTDPGETAEDAPGDEGRKGGAVGGGGGWVGTGPPEPTVPPTPVPNAVAPPTPVPNAVAPPTPVPIESNVRRTRAKSSRNSPSCGDRCPPPCRIAAGWNVGITVRPCQSWTCPRRRVIPSCVFSTN